MGQNKLAIFLATGFVISGAASAEIEDNPGYEDAYTAWAAAHLALLPVSFLPGPIGTVADLANIGVDVNIKYQWPLFVAPTVPDVVPNSNDECSYEFMMPRISADYSNLFGLVDLQTLATDWGPLGTPLVGHAQADVEVRVSHPSLAGWSDSTRQVSFVSGINSLRWSAATQIDPLLDIALPIALFAVSAEIKYSSAFLATDPKSAARANELPRSKLTGYRCQPARIVPIVCHYGASDTHHPGP